MKNDYYEKHREQILQKSRERYAQKKQEEERRKRYKKICKAILWRDALQQRITETQEQWLKNALQNQIELINLFIYGKKEHEEGIF